MSVTSSSAALGCLPSAAEGEHTGRVPEDDEPSLTVDEAYRAAFHFINQYYEREPIVPFALMLHSMTPGTPGGNPRQTSDPATWHDWLSSVRAARTSEQLPDIGALRHDR
jgi:hypothetical protein